MNIDKECEKMEKSNSISNVVLNGVHGTAVCCNSCHTMLIDNCEKKVFVCKLYDMGWRRGGDVLFCPKCIDNEIKGW